MREHWNLRYAVDRLRLAWHQRRHPDDPWLTAGAVSLLDTLVRPADVCFEWGSGRSTAWLAPRVATVTSVEHDRTWHDSVRRSLEPWPNASVRLVEGSRCEYVGAIEAHGPVDVVLVDGLHRGECAVAAVAHLRPGGVLVIDDAQRYLPSSSRAPEAIGRDFAGPEWAAFAEGTSSWRRLWTSDGVTDTAIFLVP